MSTMTLAQRAAEQPLPLLILDFDGTLCLGDGPVLAYAAAVTDQIPESARKSLHEALAQFLAQDSNAPAYKDGYAAVAALSEGLLDEAALSQAYTESRRQLAAGEVTISAPDGLAAFLDQLEGVAFRIVLTNAPLTGVAESLTTLGLAPSIDLIIADANKPGGFTELLPDFLQDRAPYELLSVGDVWSNDIEVPARAGCATAFIDRFNHQSGAATLRAARFELLYAAITDWAHNPAVFISNQPSISTPSSEKAPL
ncbi:hydrolase [Arthrobacter sp. TMP15]|uniref:HAD family hydrolase n=1 Tax=Arthrobacter sp. TMP15 TaxID=3140789 RepID=UPI0031BBBB59